MIAKFRGFPHVQILFVKSVEFYPRNNLGSNLLCPRRPGLHMMTAWQTVLPCGTLGSVSLLSYPFCRQYVVEKRGKTTMSDGHRIPMLLVISDLGSYQVLPEPVDSR